MVKKLYKYWFGPSLKIYPTISMTGKTGAQVWRKYRQQRLIGRKYNISIHSPVPGEGIPDNNQLLIDRKGRQATRVWSKDKNQINNVNAISFEKANMKSQGSLFELVKARGSRWKITIFVHSKPGFIAREQSDIYAKSLEAAYKEAAKRFSSRHQRAVWRFKMLIRSLPKFIWHQIREFWI